MVVASHTASNTFYLCTCRIAGLPPHPAQFSAVVQTWWMRLLTRRNALGGDPVAGSTGRPPRREGLFTHVAKTGRAMVLVVGGSYYRKERVW